MEQIYITIRILTCLLLCSSFSKATVNYLFRNLFKNSGQSNSFVPKNDLNICIYSNDPYKYQPKCFKCMDDAYLNIARACADNSNRSENVTYTEASCIERNCAINYPMTVNPSAIRARMTTPDDGNEVFMTMSFSENLRECRFLYQNLNSPEAQNTDTVNLATPCEILFALKEK